MGFTTNYFSLGINGGLPKIGKSKANQFVKNFLLKRPSQPSFIIGREEWEELCSPRSFVAGENDNIPAGDYEVYAIVFCIGIWDHSANFYFRIRRIYKPANKPRYRGKLYIDDKNIAYGDTTRNSNENERKIQFISATNDPDEFKSINLFIDLFKQSLQNDPDFRASLPIVGMKDSGELIIQEGNIFGKKRILDELLNGKYSHQKRQEQGKPPVDFVKVNFALNTETNNLFFVFNINDDYETGIKCPAPVVCL